MKGMPMEPNEQLAITLPTLTELVAGTEASQLDNPTACANFTVRGVVDHLLGGARSFAPAFRGQQDGDSAPRDVAPTGREVPTVAFRYAMVDLLDAINTRGAMERPIDGPFGRAPGAVVARFLAFDTLVHGWDLASATSQAYDPPLDLVVAADAFARQVVGPELRDGDTFAPETAAPDGASRLEQLVAFSGRTISPDLRSTATSAG